MKCRICIRETPNFYKQQRPYNVCKGKKDIQAKDHTIFEKYNLTPLCTMNHLIQLAKRTKKHIRLLIESL